jgi:hypothetical protein
MFGRRDAGQAAAQSYGEICMQRYQIVYSLIHAAIAALLLFFVKNIDFLSRTFQEVAHSADYGQWAVLALVPLLATLFKFSDELALVLIEKIPVVSPLLRRVLAGEDFVEGAWPLVVIKENTGELLYLGFLTLSHEHGELRVDGVDWRPDGAPAHGFHSEQSRYANRLLQYWYGQGRNDVMRGYTEIHFFPRKGLARRHAGEFLDKQHANVRFYAMRVRQKRRTVDEKIAEAKKVWAALQPKLPRLLAQDITLDWE